MTEFFEHGKIDNQITDRDSDTRFTFFRLKDTEWEILNGKMRVGRDFDETAQRRIHEYHLITKRAAVPKKNCSSSTDQL
jgi:hypothetical protein